MHPLGTVQYLEIVYFEKFAIIFYLFASIDESEAINVLLHTAGRLIELYTMPVFNNSCGARSKTNNCPII
jgi:hypothetical protein